MLKIDLHPELICFVAGIGELESFPSFTVERWYVERAVFGRQKEFLAGRKLARIALQELGYSPVPLGVSERLLIWPVGVRGSISHTKDLVAVAVTKAGVIQSVCLSMALTA